MFSKHYNFHSFNLLKRGKRAQISCNNLEMSYPNKERNGYVEKNKKQKWSVEQTRGIYIFSLNYFFMVLQILFIFKNQEVSFNNTG